MNYINFKVKHLKWLVFLGVLSVFFMGTTKVQYPTTPAGWKNVVASDSTTWTSIGPYGGCINSLAMSVTNPDIIYAGTERGVFKTIDGCANWTKTNLSENDISVVQVDASNHDIVYAGTNLDGIYKSEDGGSTWISFNGSLANLSITNLTISAIPPQMLYAGTDSGGVWNISLSPPGDVNGDGDITLADAILALKVACGFDTTGENVIVSADVNGDEKIGVADVIYIIQKILD